MIIQSRNGRSHLIQRYISKKGESSVTTGFPLGKMAYCTKRRSVRKNAAMPIRAVPVFFSKGISGVAKVSERKAMMVIEEPYKKLSIFGGIR